MSDQPVQTYTCAMCGETYEYAWTDEEAIAEKDALWGDVPLEECDVICDDCFQVLMAGPAGAGLRAVAGGTGVAREEPE